MYILSRDICYTMYIQKEVSRMEMLPIKKMGQ